ncbi:MAG: hypothetical protein RIG84_19000 [Roseovarius sp.]
MTAIMITLLAAIVIYFTDKTFFWKHFAAEDGFIEYGTMLFLFASALLLWVHALSLWGKGRRGAALLTLFYGLLFFMAAGEEVSWGQRIFGWESGEFFQESNKQNETNLHNLVVGNVHLASTLFGSFLTTVLLLYLVVLPLCYGRVSFITRLADRFVVPVPGMRHAVLAVLSSLVIAPMDVYRNWEVYEFVFSLLAFSIFLLPQNREKVI